MGGYYQRGGDWLSNKEIDFKSGSGKNSDNQPPRKSGFKGPLYGFIIGAIAGGILGSFFNFLIPGAIGGGVLGSYVSALVKKYKRYRDSKKGDKGIFS